ncbi:type 1 glutamine amidotransferase [Novosphingobium acidiphilum]|uniref:type 1 glutamine amidotransferase n=1 Tax=Novosphingobium acidiphilum TaxID=505248 RepID=UPI00042202F9|nr:type 1 glutamine amidotransferase [Novosphingobium acidiphilum]
MKRLLLLEGNPADRRAVARTHGVRWSSEIYARAIAAHCPDLVLEVVYGADPGEGLPAGRAWTDYAGLVITGSALHAYDRDAAVTAQIALMVQAADHGLPIFGSCWGLQIAAVAAGGTVARSARGREVGFARKIAVTPAGRVHPMFAHKGPVFDAPCIHYDEVTALPAGAILLAGNAHSAVQAAVIPLGRSTVWAVQYHPEFDLAQIAQLNRLDQDDMIAQGFFADHAALAAYNAMLETLHADRSRADLAWQLGIDADLLDDRRRAAEIMAWVNSEVIARA